MFKLNVMVYVFKVEYKIIININLNMIDWLLFIVKWALNLMLLEICSVREERK